MIRERLLVRAVAVLFVCTYSFAQSTFGTQLAELVSLRDKVASPDTRARVDATHRVWTIALASPDSDVKLSALKLLAEPVGSASDHIRMPALYAIAEIANSTEDSKVKIQ